MSIGLLVAVLVHMDQVPLCAASYLRLGPHSSLPPTSYEPKFAAQASELDEGDRLASCFLSGRFIRSKDGPLKSFTAAGASQCWLYCKSIMTCRALSFELMNGTCSLYGKYYEPYYQQHRTNEGRPLTLVKRCMERMDKTSIVVMLPEIVSLSIAGTGFLIRRNFGENARCLSEGVSLSMEMEEETYNAVTWKSCKKGSRWALQEVNHADDKLMALKYYQISPVEDQDMCLDARTHFADDRGQYLSVFLSKCRNITSINDDPQIMFIEIEALPETTHDNSARHSIFSISGVDEDGISILYTGTDYHESLHGISFMDPVLYRQVYMKSCPLSQFSTPHGTVRNKENIPFVLPGLEVEIQCAQGYGVKRLNFTALQILVCSTDAKPQPCRRIVPRKSCRNNDKEEKGMKEKLCYTFLMITVSSSITVVVLLVVLLMSKHRVTMEEDIVEEKN